MQKFSKVFTLMVAMLALAYCAVSCKVNVDDEPTLYTVTVASSIEHGKVSVDKSSAEAGTTIKLTATADEGYQLDSYSVKDASSNAITVTDGTFTMPKSNVTVSATFTKTAATLNQEAADAVITKITAIGTVAYTTESKTKIDDARTAYDELTGAQKALIPAETLAVLTKAETDYNALKTSADEAAANQAAAEAVIAKINAIGTVTYTSESKAKIDDARTAYDALTEAQKELVPKETLALLTAAESTYAELKAAADSETANQNAADAVIAKINAIGTVTYTSESKAKIDDARAAYNALTEAQKALVPAETLALLTAAETSYNSQKATANKANAVIAKITAIGTVTYTSESKAKIDEARTAYDALTEAQKALVPTETLALLTAAESTYAELKAAADSETANQNAANAVIAKITVIGTVAYTAESKAKIDEARTAYDALTEAQKALIPAETLALLTAAETKYAELKAAAEQQTAGSISYATESVKKTTDSTAFTNELTKIGNGTVTYSSSDENVATVNASTGEVTIVGAGTATITATVVDSDTYTYAVKTASYTVKVLSETLLTTITATGKEQASYSTENVATVSFSYTANGASSYSPTTTWGWWGYGWIATVTPADGYTITKCVFYDDKERTATDSEAPFVVETTEDDKTPQVNGTPILAYQSKGITKIEVYGYVNP